MKYGDSDGVIHATVVPNLSASIPLGTALTLLSPDRVIVLHLVVAELRALITEYGYSDLISRGQQLLDSS